VIRNDVDGHLELSDRLGQTQAVLARLNGKVVLHLLPPYCPDHNRIERVWRDLHPNVTRNHQCRSMKERINVAEVAKTLARTERSEKGGMMTTKTVAVAALFVVAQLCAEGELAARTPNARPDIGSGWEQCFKAGMIDPSTGKPIRGTEIVHLAAHKGRLYAGNGYWMDTRFPNIPWSQVLVLDSRDGTWKVDLALGPKHLRVTTLKSVTFTTDADGKALASPVNLLLAASDIHHDKRESNVWTRNDQNNTWVKTTLPAGHELRRSTRAFAIHRDQQTGVDRIFVAAGAPGIYSGVCDARRPGKIRWDKKAELGPVTFRPMSFVEASGRLYASAGVSVYRRTDGLAPRWEKVYSDDTREHWELGGIRGLTAVPSPKGVGESILFSHTDRIIRVDPNDAYRATIELRIRPLLTKSWGADVKGSIIAAYTDMMPLKDPATGRTVHIMGVQGRIQRRKEGKQYRPDTYGGWYAGGSYLIREPDQSYRLKEVNGRWEPGKPKLVAPRTFAISPFPEDADGHVYFAGFDCNFFPALDTAWIFRAPMETVLSADP